MMTAPQARPAVPPVISPAIAPEPAPLLDVRGLTISYGNARGTLRAASDVSFAIRPGEVMGLVGESGSGKSTVAMAILDLLGGGGRVDSGEILFDGVDLRRLSPFERQALRGDRIAAVFQDPFTSLNPALTVGHQIAEPLIQHRGLSPGRPPHGCWICWPRSASAIPAGSPPPIRTSCRAACSSGR